MAGTFVLEPLYRQFIEVRELQSKFEDGSVITERLEWDWNERDNSRNAEREESKRSIVTVWVLPRDWK